MRAIKSRAHALMVPQGICQKAPLRPGAHADASRLRLLVRWAVKVVADGAGAGAGGGGGAGSGLSSRVKEIVADLEAWEGRLQEMEQRAVRAEAEEKKLRAENAALRMAATTGTAQPPPPVAEVPATSSYSTSYSKTPGAVTADPAADEAKPKTLAKIMIFVVVALLLILVAAVGWKKYSDQLRRKELDRMKRMENEPMDA